MSDYSNLNFKEKIGKAFQNFGQGISNGFNRLTNFIFNKNNIDLTHKEISRAKYNFEKVFKIFNDFKKEL